MSDIGYNIQSSHFPSSSAPAMDAGDSPPARDAVPPWALLHDHLSELILSRLTLRDAVSASASCRGWRSVVFSPSFPSAAALARRRLPWLFLNGIHNTDHRLNCAFAFDPDAAAWALIPQAANPESGDFFSGAAGFAFAARTSRRFAYATLLRGPWKDTKPLSIPRFDPLVAVVGGHPDRLPRFLIVGGARLVGHLVDIEERLDVEIYDPTADRWELCAPLPADIFLPGNASSHSLSAALVGGSRYFVYGKNTFLVASFDTESRSWSGVRSLRPQGLLFGFLAEFDGERMLLCGIARDGGAAVKCKLWVVDPESLTCVLVSAMPDEMLELTGDDYASVKCVGAGGVVYVYGQAPTERGCACGVVDVGADGSARCAWIAVPPVPKRMCNTYFHKTVAFCSPVCFDDVLAADDAAAAEP